MQTDQRGNSMTILASQMTSQDLAFVLNLSASLLRLGRLQGMGETHCISRER